MDKIDRALAASEENTLMIADLRSMIKRAVGVAFEVRMGTNGSLGVVNAPKGGVAIFTFEGSGVIVEFCGKQIAYAESPGIVEMPAGNGELKLATLRTNLRALVMYKI